MPITRETAIAVLRASHLFQSFNEEQLMLVTQHAKIKEAKTGQVLYRQGDQADAFYLIVSGDVSVDRASAKNRNMWANTGAAITSAKKCWRPNRSNGAPRSQ